MTVFRGDKLGKFLIEEGIIPKETRDFTLEISPGKPMCINMSVFVGPDQLRGVARAIVKLLESENERTWLETTSLARALSLDGRL